MIRSNPLTWTSKTVTFWFFPFRATSLTRIPKRIDKRTRTSWTIWIKTAFITAKASKLLRVIFPSSNWVQPLVKWKVIPDKITLKKSNIFHSIQSIFKIIFHNNTHRNRNVEFYLVDNKQSIWNRSCPYLYKTHQNNLLSFLPLHLLMLLYRK